MFYLSLLSHSCSVLMGLECKASLKQHFIDFQSENSWYAREKKQWTKAFNYTTHLIFHSWNTEAHLTKAVCKALIAMAALVYAIVACKLRIHLWVLQGLCTRACCSARVPFVLICRICSKWAGDETLSCRELLLSRKVWWNATLNLNNGAAVSEHMNKMSFSAIHEWGADLHRCHAISAQREIQRCLLMLSAEVRVTPVKDMALFTCFWEEGGVGKNVPWRAFNSSVPVP